jgi:hypothetical protein
MTTRTLGRRTALLTTLLASAVLVAAPLGTAAKDGDIIRTGSCSASTDWKLKLSPENGRIEVEFEVDQNRNGQTWDVRLKKNGTSFWSGQRTTQAPSGSFETRRVVSGGSGDRFTGIATNPRSGEVCRGTATFSA